MLLSVGAPDVFTIPCPGVNDVSSYEQEEVSGGFSKGLRGDSIVKVCTSLCSRYLFVLTTRVLHVYGDGRCTVYLGNFKFSESQAKEYGLFRDMFVVPGSCQICILVENLNRVLLCRYGAWSSPDLTEDQRVYTNLSGGGIPHYNFDGNRMDAPPTFMNKDTSENVRGDVPFEPKGVLQERLVTAVCESLRIRNVRDVFERHFSSFVRITLLFELILPSAISALTFANMQLFFWMDNQSGTYVTICPNGFLNYLSSKSLKDPPVKIVLHLHVTNIFQGITISGLVNVSHGLCYLSFGQKLFSKSKNKNESINENKSINGYETDSSIYCDEEKYRIRPASLVEWVSICSSQISHKRLPTDCSDDEESYNPMSPEGDGFDCLPLDADSILSVMEEQNLDSVYEEYESSIESIVGAVNSRQVEMVESRGLCFVVTTADALILFALDKPYAKHIGVAVYRNNVKSISVCERGELLAVLFCEGSLKIFRCHELKLRFMWEAKLENIDGYCWVGDRLAVCHNNSRLICFHFTGRILVDRYWSDCEGTNRQQMMLGFSRSLRLLIAHDMQFKSLDFHTGGRCEIRCTNPRIPFRSFVGPNDIILLYSDVFDGCYGVCGKKITDTEPFSLRNGHDDLNKLGGFDTRLTSIPHPNFADSECDWWPILSVACNCTGEYILTATNIGFAIYSGYWTFFGRELGEFCGLGWYSATILFVVVKTPLRATLSDPSSFQGKDVVDAESSWAYFCYFFSVKADLSEPLEVIPLKHRPFCCTVSGFGYLVYDVTHTVTAYSLKDSDDWKFDIVFQLTVSPNFEADIYEIYCIDEDKLSFVVLDSLGRISQFDSKGDVIVSIDKCSFVTPSPHRLIGDSGLYNWRKFDLLCHTPGTTLERDDSFCIVSSNGCTKVDFRLENVSVVNNGIITSLVSTKDDNVQQLRILKSPCIKHLENEELESLIEICKIIAVSPFSLELLDQLMSVFLYNSENPQSAHSTHEKIRIVGSLEQIPKDVLAQLFAILSRKNDNRKTVEDLESLFGRKICEWFAENLELGQYRSAGLMLLPLQALSDPKTVRDLYSTKIIKCLLRDVAVSNTRRESNVSLLKSLIRFHLMLVDEDQDISRASIDDEADETSGLEQLICLEQHDLQSLGINLGRPVPPLVKVDDWPDFGISELFLRLISEYNLIPVYRLCSSLRLDLLSFLGPVRGRIKEMAHWGVCCPLDTCENGNGVTLPQLIISNLISFCMVDSIDFFKFIGNLEKEVVFERLPKVNVQAPSNLAFSCSYIHSFLFRAFLRLELYIPAAAIAIACRDFLEIACIILKDEETALVVKHILTTESCCDKCKSNRSLIKHLLLKSKETYSP